MDQKIEIERMEAAFKRAADKAMNGSRDERAGRFEMRNDTRSMPPKNDLLKRQLERSVKK